MIFSGFISGIIPKTKLKPTSIVILPFINLVPSNFTTLNSALWFAKDQCGKYGIRFAPFTCDQPLYVKVAEIIASTPEFRDIFLAILGGFHMAMSYLGSIGYIMRGSGLEDMWTEVYAPDSVNQMMTGHHYSRSIRANYLAGAAVCKVISDSANPDEGLSIDTIVTAERIIMSGTESTDAETQDIVDNYQKIMGISEDDPRTRKLWKLYVKLVVILCLYIYSERVGDLELQKWCIRQMIPIFHAAGHLPYARCSRLFVQQLDDLKYRLDVSISTISL